MGEKESRYYLKLVGYTLLGLVVLAVILGICYLAVISLFSSIGGVLAFFITYILPILVVILLIIVAVIILYIALYIGVAVRYLGRPMKVSKKEKRYDIKKTREAGKRHKGSSKKTKK